VGGAGGGAGVADGGGGAAEALSTIAETTLSLAPPVLRAISPSVETSKLPGCALMVVIIRSSDMPAFTSLMMASLLSACWAKAKGQMASNTTMRMFLRTKPLLMVQNREIAKQWQ
jgi:hypothetical protein